ncbi:hypothetical protein MSG28_011207 [Choristoneura fumiferana]|uniref:Uncharacterized protein n=1 Tax=Choristoneura fumiferana TaxID=7141 RepID=A0ACC0KRH0_CHOFU|nr:hypothetical protein MSG28_011207 [Choristoneura fumiferana]
MKNLVKELQPFTSLAHTSIGVVSEQLGKRKDFLNELTSDKPEPQGHDDDIVWELAGNPQSETVIIDYETALQGTIRVSISRRARFRVMTYGSETWALTMGLMRKLKVTQRAMERAMLGVSLRDRIRNDDIRISRVSSEARGGGVRSAGRRRVTALPPLLGSNRNAIERYRRKSRDKCYRLLLADCGYSTNLCLLVLMAPLSIL